MPEELAVDGAGLLAWLQAELLIEGPCQLPIAAGHGLAHSERVLGLQREAPERLVELVQREATLGGLQRSVRIAVRQPCLPGAPEQIDQASVEVAYVRVSPRVVGSCERLSTEQIECIFEQALFLGRVRVLRSSEQALQFIEVNL